MTEDSVRVLFIDDYVPNRRLGRGMPRAVEFLRALSASGASVTVFPTSRHLSAMHPPRGELPDAMTAVPPGQILFHFLAERPGAFDAIIASRPNNLKLLRRALAQGQGFARSIAIIYDAQSLYAPREVARSEVRGNPVSKIEARQWIESEIALAAGVDTVLGVNRQTAEVFIAAGHDDVRILGHAVDIEPGSQSFEQRDGFLFVGPINSDSDANGDSVVWFVENILPRVRAGLKRDICLNVAGAVRSATLAARAEGRVVALGVVPELADIFSRMRVLVAPTRIASGLSQKACDAAAHGLPVVLTSVLAAGLGWSHQKEALVADSPEDFALACLRLHEDRTLWERLRINALKKSAEDYSRQHFYRVVADLMADVRANRLRHPPQSPASPYA